MENIRNKVKRKKSPGAAAVALMLLSAVALYGAGQPLSIAEQGSFAVGGSVAKRDGIFDPSRFAGWSRIAEEGQTYHGNHGVVDYQVPTGAKGAALLYVHGFGQSGRCWRTTPDGRDGFATLMLRRGHPAYVVSLPGRGDAGRTTAEKEVRPVADEAFWFNIWRMGDWPQHHSGSQFPQDEASLNQFFRQMTPDLSGGVMADDVAAIEGMAVRAGGGVLVTHSAGGLPGWLAAMRNEAVSGVAAYEPGGFVFPEGEAPAPMPGATGALAGVEVPVDDFLRLCRIPIVIYFGDYIPAEDEVSQRLGDENWRVRLAMGRRFAECVNRHGGKAALVVLPEIGIKGNTHFLFQEKNNMELADTLEKWLADNGLAARAFNFKTPAQIAAENNYNDNPFGLLYAGALRSNEPGKVQIHPVAYDNLGITVAANVYTPAGYDPGRAKAWPAVCVAHPNGGVKEQVAGLYAQKLAEAGFVTVAADAIYQGSSGGSPRYIDIPSNRIADIRRMVDVIAQFPGVDPDRIGLLGICGGGGYSFKAAQTDKRIRALATISAFNTGLVRREGFLGTQRDTVQKRLAEASAARAAEAAGGSAVYPPEMLDMPQEKGLALAQDLYRDGYEYYGITHRHPRSAFASTVSGMMETVGWDARDGASLLTAPLLMIAGSEADTLYLTRGMFAAATGTADKELFIVKGAHHIDTYWKPEHVAQISGKISSFFSSRLAAGDSGERVSANSVQPAGDNAVSGSGNALSAVERAVVAIGAATARGDQAALAAALNAGFEAGLSLNEAKELVGQLYAYCGFPRALNAAATLMAVADERTAAGKRPAEGPVNSPLPSGSSRDFGRENQTRLCGREVKGALFDFHPQLDEYLKAHLFGDIFARDSVSWRIREIVTIAALAARRETEPQMKSHLGVGRINGISGAQAAEILHLVRCPEDPALLPPDWSAFPVGEPNAAYARYFTGRSFLAPVSRAQQNISAVTFAPGCRNNWHIHHAGKDGGQILMVTAGEGYYREWGKPARRLCKGDMVNIPAGVRHWHGAAPDSWFQHLAVEVPGVDCHTEWLEPVSDQAYAAAVK